MNLGARLDDSVTVTVIIVVFVPQALSESSSFTDTWCGRKNHIERNIITFSQKHDFIDNDNKELLIQNI